MTTVWVSYVDRLFPSNLYLPGGTAAAMNAVIYFVLTNRELFTNSTWSLMTMLYANVFTVSLPFKMEIGGNQLALIGRDRL